jgi:two-component system chemotaxis response regulator CheB
MRRQFMNTSDSRDRPTQEDSEFKVVGVASSAGGVKALSALLSSLKADFPSPVVIVQHVDPTHPSMMADILNRRSQLVIKQAREGDKLAPGTVFIAPPDHHLLVNPDGTLSLSHSELVHFVRPSADLLFESLAASYGARSIAVVLTGSGQDGSLGVTAIKKVGGTVIAQDEESSEFFGMPRAAIATGDVDYVVPLDKIGELLLSLVRHGCRA